MAASYDELRKLLANKKMSRAELRKVVDISSNTLTRMIKDEYVTLEWLSRICDKSECDFGDIVTYYVSDSKTNNTVKND